jgi:ubiquinone/menaquinone biosynthesis C-methylase UbiE
MRVQVPLPAFCVRHNVLATSSGVMTISDFSTKILSGEETSPEEWQQHLREVHGRLPGMTSRLCSTHATPQGETSYQLLADRAVAAARALDRPVDVLDLACGDGYLIQICLRQLGRDVTITGVDMSEGELDAARQRLAGQNACLYVGLAQSLPLATASVDVALCHLAFMLMVPVAPVVQELARVLRPGGIFSAVVGSTSSPASALASGAEELDAPRALWRQIGVALRQFWQEEYPQLQTDGRVSDPRAMTKDGWEELFRPETGYTGGVEVQEFEILFRESAEGIWNFFKDTYLVDLLDATMREKVRSRLRTVIVEHERAHGTLDMAFPHRMLSARRQ